MNRVLEVSEGDMDCQVEAGVTRSQLNQHLRESGLFFPVDPGADATLGGMTATRALGTNAVRYGTMRDNVRGLTVVLPDGRVLRTGRRVRKSSAGYDLPALFVGSEGTLGVITEVALRLYGQPESVSAAMCSFPDVQSAVDAVTLIMQSGTPVARIELMDAAMVDAVNRFSKLELEVAPTLFFEFHGASTAAVEEAAAAAGEVAADCGGSDFKWATSPEERSRLWAARHQAYYAARALRPGCGGFPTDLCVPLTALAPAVEQAQALCARRGVLAPLVGHVGDSNFHLLIPRAAAAAPIGRAACALMARPPGAGACAGSAEEVAAAKACADEMIAIAQRLGGTCTGEHGVGYGKLHALHAEHGEAGLGVMHAIKQASPAEFTGFKASSAFVGAPKTADFHGAVARQSVAAGAGSKQTTVCAKKVRVAINGFGRIGRQFLRCVEGREHTNLEIVALNDSGGVKQASHLLKYDSTMGTFNADVKVIDDTHFSVNGKVIQVVSSRDPTQLPWKALDVDIVIEGTGVFIDTKGASKHLEAGAKKVLITAPAKGSDIPTYVVGVNAHDYKHSDNIISNASCTTNCLAPFVKVLDEKFGIVKGTMTTTHSYTGDQRLLDASHRDLRRARAAALNIVPTTTGAAKAVALVLPKLKGKLNGVALRVPTPTVSVVDLVVQVEKKTFAEEVNEAFREAANGPLKGILGVSDEPLVSCDYKQTNVSSTIDAALTMASVCVMGDDMVKVVAWYDNEWGYSQRVVDLAEVVATNWQ
eukprot:scaffold12.g8190.t1